MREYFKTCMLAVLTAGSAAPAVASTTYLGMRQVGAGTVDLAVTTDGRTGTLAASDIVAWTVTLRDPTSATPLRVLTRDGAASTLRSDVVIGGAAVSATSTALNFTYGLGDLEFDADYTIRPFYQVVSDLCATGVFGDAGASEQFDTGSDFSSSRAEYTLHSGGGTVVLAEAAAVPEAAAWSMMIAGFGLLGWRMRLRTLVAA